MGAPWSYESGWKTIDLDNRFVKLDQSDPQSVSGGRLLFEEGFAIGNSSSYLTLNSDTIELHVNGTLRQSWTTASVTAAPVFIETGNPMGLLLGLTYQL